MIRLLAALAVLGSTSCLRIPSYQAGGDGGSGGSGGEAGPPVDARFTDAGYDAQLFGSDFAGSSSCSATLGLGAVGSGCTVTVGNFDYAMAFSQAGTRMPSTLLLYSLGSGESGTAQSMFPLGNPDTSQDAMGLLWSSSPTETAAINTSQSTATQLAVKRVGPVVIVVEASGAETTPLCGGVQLTFVSRYSFFVDGRIARHDELAFAPDDSACAHDSSYTSLFLNDAPFTRLTYMPVGGEPSVLTTPTPTETIVTNQAFRACFSVGAANVPGLHLGLAFDNAGSAAQQVRLDSTVASAVSVLVDWRNTQVDALQPTSFAPRRVANTSYQIDHSTECGRLPTSLTAGSNATPIPDDGLYDATFAAPSTALAWPSELEPGFVVDVAGLPANFSVTVGSDTLAVGSDYLVQPDLLGGRTAVWFRDGLTASTPLTFHGSP